MSALRWVALTAWVAFAGYTLYCARTESFFGSIRKIWALRWGRQMTFDLYAGLLLFGVIVYLNEGSLLLALAWIVPSLALGNLVPLLYFVLRFDLLAAHFA
ncbi:MAG: hypothetical protein ACJ790_10990 [Myxococcaceae bacterium]